MTVAVAASADVLSLLAPLTGVLVPLGDVPDPVFAQRLAGDGISLDPLSARVLAPCDGRVLQIHRARHALTLAARGLEIVIHVGIDTVGLDGAGFKLFVETGDTVRAGDPLLEFDTDAVARGARSLLTQMLISESELVGEIRPRTGRVVGGVDVAMEVSLRAGHTPAATAPRTGKAHRSGPIVVDAAQGLHARPAALLAAAARRFTADLCLMKDGREANLRSVVSIMSLEVAYGATVEISARGEDAVEAIAAVSRLLAELADDHAPLPPLAPLPTAPPVSAHVVRVDDGMLHGVAASPGVAVGQVFQLRYDDVVIEERASDPEHERRALDAAIAAAHLQLDALRSRLAEEADEDRAAIFSAHQELLQDPEVRDHAAAVIRDGASAAFAWREAFTSQAARLAALANPVLAGRATDLRDAGRRVLHLLAGREIDRQEVPPNSIVIAEDLTPSDTASLDRECVLGFCTTMGSATSHVAILARGFGIPAVAGIDPRALELAPGTRVLLDGDAGTVTIAPTAAEEEAVRQRRVASERAYDAAHAAASDPATTRDLHRIEVVGNIGTVAEARRVAELGGEGVGLLRTEFMFMERSSAPTEDDQTASYTAIARILGTERILVIRTLDVGGDKPLPYLSLATEANPFLGERGVRLTLSRPELFRTQIRAVLRASLAGKVAIMFPMIATLAEWRAARELVEEERTALGVPPIPTGIMVETAAAALLAEHFAREADFLSIGTNDLTQYTLAMDRTNPRLAPQVDALHPSVLRLIAATVEGGHAHGRWVGVCGALAGDRHAVPVLLGLGVDELSVDVPLIPTVKAQIRTLSRGECRGTAREALAAGDGNEVRRIVEQRHG